MGVELLPIDDIPCLNCWLGTLATDSSVCTECAQRAPAEYFRLYRTLGLTAIQAFGWPGHGKSTLLGALTLVLTRMSMVWPNYFYRALSESTVRKLRDLNNYVRTGGLPPPTTTDDGAVLLLLRNAGPWGDRLIAYRDCPGELFDNLDVDTGRLPLLRHAPATFLVLSPSDLTGVASGRAMEMLMWSFVRALETGAGTASLRRSAVVVLTKADAMTNLPNSIRTYLKQDGPWSLLHDAGHGERGAMSGFELPPSGVPGTDAYRAGMSTASEALRTWLEEGPAGRTLVRIADDHGIALSFSAVSATGSQVDDNGFLPSPWHPRRVIDPLLWALQHAPQRVTFFDGGDPTSPRGVHLV